MNVQLTISLLVSDRIETLGKCLNSLKPLLRELDSELIVVFTGEKEETLALVQQYTSHITPFIWCNDFSKARNAGLKEAKGEWFLYLDDDEWFEDTGEIIRFFQSGEYRHYQSAFYVQRNYEDFEGIRYSDAEVGRMCRLTPGKEFISPIHEYLSPLERPKKSLTAFVHHFGYVGKKESRKEDAKANRNLPLLLEMYEKEPDSAQTCMQITQEYQSMGEYKTAAEYCQKGLALSRKEARIYTHELWMQVQLPTLIHQTDGPRPALEEAERILKHQRTLEAGILHLCIKLTELCQELREYRKGLRYIFLYQEKLACLRNHPEKAMLQNAGDVTVDSAVSKEINLYIDGLFFAAEIDDFRKIQMLFSWIPWDVKDRVLPWYPRLEEWKKKYDKKTRSILKEYNRLDTWNIYVCIQKMLFAEIQRQKNEDLWGICANDCPPGMQWELLEIAVRSQFSLEPLLIHMSPEAWRDYAVTVTAAKTSEGLQAFYTKIQPLLKKYPFYARQLEQSVLERQLVKGRLNPFHLSDLLRQYCASVLADAEARYRKEPLANPSAYALPSRYQFAAIVTHALSLMEQNQSDESLSLLKDAIRLCPQMSAAVSQLIGSLNEQNSDQQNQNEY